MRARLSFLALSLSAAVLVGLELRTSYQAELAAATREVTDLALLLESKIDTEYSAASEIAAIMARDIDAAALTPAQAAVRGAQVRRWLASYLAIIPSASALRIFDAQGNRLYTTTEAEVPFNIADRDFFQQFQQDPARSLIHSKVMLGRTTGRLSQYVARAIRGPQGEFKGIALVAIDLERLQQHFKRINVGSDGVLSLGQLADGAIVVRHPGRPELPVQQPLAVPGLADLRQSGEARVLSYPSPVDGHERLYAQRVVGRHPLFVSVGLAPVDYLANWWRHAVSTVLLALLALGLLALALWRAARADAARDADAQRLRASEARFRALIDHNAAPILQIDPATGLILDANAAACTFYGWTHDQIVAKHIQEVNQLPPERVAELRAQALSEQRQVFHFPHRLASGEVRCVEVHTTPVEVGGHVMLVSIIHDVTERQAVEEQLARASAENQDLYDHAPCGYHTLDAQGRIVRINAVGRDWLGGADQAIEGRPISDFFTPEGVEIFRENFPIFLREGRIEALEFDLNTPGGPRHVSVSATAIRDAQGNFIGSRSVMYDVTALQEARQALARLTAEQQAMLDTDMIGIVRVRDLHIHWVNRGMLRMFGYAEGELEGQTARRLFVDVETADRVGEQATQALEKGQRFRITTQLRHRDGHLLWIDLSGSRAQGGDDESLWLLADVTALKAQQQAIEHAALHDALTGLPNRGLLNERLALALARGRRAQATFAVCFLDLDGFKAVNDRFGHRQGDVLLRQLAVRLQAAVRGGDLACRLGGDEFVLLLTDAASASDYEAVIARVLAEVARAFVLEDGVVAEVSASVGVALYPQHGSQADVLMRLADHAMYQAKLSGRNRVVLAAAELPLMPSHHA